MKNTILVATHRSGVIEMDRKNFEFYSSFFGFFPEHDKFKDKTRLFIEDDYEDTYEDTYKAAIKKRRREYSKTDEFRRVPIEDTIANWWRESRLRERKEPNGRKQQMSQYQIDTKYNNLNLSKPTICYGSVYDDPIMVTTQRSWKTDKKVKRQWMKHKNKKVNNFPFNSITDFTLFNELYQEALTDLFFGRDLEGYYDSEFEETYKEEIEKELSNG